MPINVNTKPFDLNKFWEKTPNPLKYLLIIALIVGSSYFFISKKVDNSQIKELAKIEQGIEVTYQLVERFDTYQKIQSQYNQQMIDDVAKLYALVQELNDNVNSKFNYLIKNSGKYNQDLLDKMILLNESFDKLSKAYQPSQSTQPYDPQISIKKIEK